MALDERLMEILVCPECRSGLEHKARRKVLVCLGCGLEYPVRDDIPVMLAAEARRPRQR